MYVHPLAQITNRNMLAYLLLTKALIVMQYADVPAGDTTVTLTTPIILDLHNGTELQSTDVDSCWFAVRENATGDGTNGYSWSYVHTSRASGPVSHP